MLYGNVVALQHSPTSRLLSPPLKSTIQHASARLPTLNLNPEGAPFNRKYCLLAWDRFVGVPPNRRSIAMTTEQLAIHCLCRICNHAPFETVILYSMDSGSVSESTLPRLVSKQALFRGGAPINNGNSSFNGLPVVGSAITQTTIHHVKGVTALFNCLSCLIWVDH